MKQISHYKKNIKLQIKNKLSHLSQIHVLEEVFLDLKKSFKNLKIEDGKGISYTIQRIQIRVLTNALTEINESIIALLKSKLFNGSDPLARVALEHSINLIYILSGDDHKHSKELLKNYIDTTLTSSKRWHKFAIDSGDENAINISKQKVDYMLDLKKGHASLYDGTCKDWPQTYERFIECGHESAYRTLFSMNSDSVHSLSEDVYNFSTISNYPKGVQPLIFEYFHASNASLSMYHGIKAIHYYGLVLYEISNKLLNYDEKKDIEINLERLVALLEVHESETLEKYKQ